MTDRSPAARRLGLALASAGVAACASPDAGVHVRATFGGERLAGLEVQALPFDPDRLLDSLAAAAPAPRPAFPGLDSALMAFVPPDARAFDEAGTSWRILRDSVAALADSLHGLDRRTRAYAALYDRFRAMYGRLAERTADRDRAIRELAGEDRRLAARARIAAESLRAWEREAFARLDSLVEAALLSSGRAAETGVTDEAGALHLALGPGTWWLVARRPDPRNPFREFRWSQEVVVTSWLPVHLPMTPATAEPRWRH